MGVRAFRPAMAPGNPFLCGGSQEPGPKSVPGDPPRREGDVVSPPLPLASASPTLFPETSEVAEEWDGRSVDTENAWERELGGWRRLAQKGSIGTRKTGPWG